MEEFGFATCFKQSKCRAIHSNIVVKCRHRAAPTAFASDAAVAAVCVFQLMASAGFVIRVTHKMLTKYNENMCGKLLFASRGISLRYFFSFFRFVRSVRSLPSHSFIRRLPSFR